jgi:hypothetical protein
MRRRCEKIPSVLKLRSARLLLASSAWLTIYVFCVLVVASFIFFEVLDVDGSDFPKNPTQMVTRLAESHHDDIKRLWRDHPVKLWTGAVALELDRPERADPDVPAQASSQQPMREHHAVLPRAALGDVPPSA